MVSSLDRGEAVNLARNILDNPDPYRYLGVKALQGLATAVIAMDDYIKKLDPYGRGVVKVAEDF